MKTMRLSTGAYAKARLYRPIYRTPEERACDAVERFREQRCTLPPEDRSPLYHAARVLLQDIVAEVVRDAEQDACERAARPLPLDEKKANRTS